MRLSKIIILTFFLLTLIGCKEPIKHEFLYQFESKEDNTKENIKKVIEVLKLRLDAFGLSSEIKPVDNGISITAFSNKLNKKRLDKLIVNQGKLEFWETFNAQRFYKQLKI